MNLPCDLKVDLKFLRNLVQIPLKIKNKKGETVGEQGSMLIEMSNFFESGFAGKRETLWLVKKFGRRVVCTDFNLKINFSLGDASYTGLGTGALWSGISMFLGFLQSYLKYSKIPRFIIIPEFEKGEFWEASLRVKLKTRPYYFLALFLMLLMGTAKKNILKRIRWRRKKGFKFES